MFFLFTRFYFILIFCFFLQNQNKTIDFHFELKREEKLKKPPSVRLQEKLSKLEQGYAGLEFVEEVMSCTRAEMEPFYKCKLCVVNGNSDEMLTHLLSRGHQETFLKNLFKVQALDDLADLQSMIESVKQNGKFNLMTTIYR